MDEFQQNVSRALYLLLGDKYDSLDELMEEVENPVCHKHISDTMEKVDALFRYFSEKNLKAVK